ncbi:MAG: hypothetical protein WD468_05105 [Pirellulales bacterium]
MKTTTLDATGNMLLPSWFLKFIIAVATLVTITFIPWAAAVTRNLNALTNDVTALRVQSDARSKMYERVVQNIDDRIEQIELKLDRLERQSTPHNSSKQE